MIMDEVQLFTGREGSPATAVDSVRPLPLNQPGSFRFAGYLAEDKSKPMRCGIPAFDTPGDTNSEFYHRRTNYELHAFKTNVDASSQRR